MKHSKTSQAWIWRKERQELLGARKDEEFANISSIAEKYVENQLTLKTKGQVRREPTLLCSCCCEAQNCSEGSVQAGGVISFPCWCIGMCNGVVSFDCVLKQFL